MVRNEHYVKEAARILFEQGIYVNPISYPAVPEKIIPSSLQLNSYAYEGGVG